MNRTDELTDRLIDGALTDDEAGELEALLAADPAAQARHLASVRLELTLRGFRTEFDIAGPTVAKIVTDRLERTTTAVMASLAQRPAPARSRPAQRARVAAALTALAAGLLLAVWLGLRAPANLPVPNELPSTSPEFARLTKVSGLCEVVDALGATPAAPGQSLTAGQKLRTVGEESMAVLEFSDRAQVEVHPESVVQLGVEATGEHLRRLTLIEGRITAVTTDPLVVGAGTTEVEANRGSFALSSAGSGSAWVESTDGDVRVSRAMPAEDAVRLGPGRAVFVRDELTPVRIDASWQTDSVPRSRLDFMALDAGFTPEGDVVAASAKQWTRWTPGMPDPGRTLFPPKVFNDGLASWLTPDLRSVALCRVDDREPRVVLRELPSGAEKGQVPIRVSEPRFLCVSPDASWIATAGGQKMDNRKVRLWKVSNGQERFTFELSDSVTCLAASPDGRRLAVGVTDLGRKEGNAVVMFDTNGGERLFDLPTQRKPITTLAFSADGKHLAVGFNGAVQLWDVPGRTLLRMIEGFERGVTRLAYSPQGDRVAAGTQDGQVWVWSTTTGLRTQVLDTGTRGVRSLSFNADGKRLVTATNKAPVAVWDVASQSAIDPSQSD